MQDISQINRYFINKFKTYNKEGTQTCTSCKQNIKISEKFLEKHIELKLICGNTKDCGTYKVELPYYKDINI